MASPPLSSKATADAPRPPREERSARRLRRDDVGAPTAPTIAPGPTQPAPLLTIGRILRQRKWWVLQGLVIVPLVVLGLTLRQQELYTAEASLLFRDAATSVLGEDAASGINDPARVAATNDALIGLPVIAERSSAALDGRLSPTAISDAITVTPSDESDLVAISATYPDAYLAARIANVYGESYIAFRQRSDRRQLQEAIDLARQRLVELTPAQRIGAPGNSLEERLNRLLLAQQLLTGNAELVQRAEVPAKPSSPDLRRNMLLGILLGLVLGLSAGAIRERLDRTIKTDAELEEIYGVPVLARLPRSRKVSAGLDELNRSPDAEAFRILRANLRYFDVDGRLSSILLSSPVSGDGKSTVARGLAATMASLGDHIVLVEADLHKASSPTLGRQPETGLSTVLSGGSLDDALYRVPAGESRQLAVLPAGPVPPNPVELLESNRMRQMLAELTERFELVLIDSPALAHVSDARPLVGIVSGILIISALGHTSRPDAVDFRKQLQLLDGHPLGVVANFAPTLRGGYYY